MRPYLAIIKDSFRAAIASRVLYVLLVLITLFLLAIAPFSLTETLTTEVAERDIFTRGQHGVIDVTAFMRLAERITEAAARENPSMRKAVWEQLSPETQLSIKSLVPGDETDGTAGDKTQDEDSSDQIRPNDPAFPFVVATVAQQFRNDLNRVIEQEDFYDEEIWRKERLSEEAQELIKQQGKLSKEKRARLNRILVSSAIPEIDRGNETSLKLKYAVWDMTTIPLRREQVKTEMGSWLPYVLDKFILSIGVFIAILVTAPIIPNTFDPGGLNLLLSKPVSRSMLLFAKFIGGCAFVAICAVYLFIGMWTVFGIRLGIWNNAILISIPIYILVFAIYYSVSAGAGVIWRNTVICVVLAILFWLVCFSVGSMNSLFDSGVSKQQITKLVQGKSETLGVDDIGGVYRWNVSEGQWQMVLLEPELQDGMTGLYFAAFMADNLGLRMPLGPVYLEEYDQIVCGQVDFPPQVFNSNLELIVTSANDGWQTKRVAPLPNNTFAMFKDHKGKLLLATKEGTLLRLKTDPLRQFARDNAPVRVEEVPVEASDDTGEETDGIDTKAKSDPGKKKQNFLSKLLGGNPEDNYFEKLEIDGRLNISSATSVAINESTGQIAFASARSIVFVETDGDGYKVSDMTIDLPGDSAVSTSIALGGKYLLAARGNGNLLLFNVGSGELLETFQPESASVYRSVSAAPDGSRFAVTFTNGNLWSIESQERNVVKASVGGQGDISAAVYDTNESLVVVDRTSRLTNYNAGDYSRIDTRSPNLATTDKLFRYFIHPAYVICPKPGEFYKLINHLSISDSNEVDKSETVAAETAHSSPWIPLWSGLGFMVVVLALSCIYFERQEF